MTQTFCRHNRFIQRCPICRETVPGHAEPRSQAQAHRRGHSAAGRRGRGRLGEPGPPRVPAGAPLADRPHLHPPHPGSARPARGALRGRRLPLRAGPRPALIRGRQAARAGDRLRQRAAADAHRRAAQPVRGGARLRGHRAGDLDVLPGRLPLAACRASNRSRACRQALLSSWASGTIPELEEVPLGPRRSHDPARGGETLVAYRRFAEHAGSQEAAFTGEPEWTPQRRFERAVRATRAARLRPHGAL